MLAEGHLRFCDPSLAGSGCDLYGTSFTRTEGRNLESSTVLATAGTGAEISLSFDLSLNGDANGAVSGDFFDPLSIESIEVNDPNTGLLIPGATITGLSKNLLPGERGPGALVIDPRRYDSRKIPILHWKFLNPLERIFCSRAFDHRTKVIDVRRHLRRLCELLTNGISFV